MKTKHDPRHLKRINLMQQLYTWDFNETTQASPQVAQITQNLKKIDELIKKSAPERPIEQINKIDLAILRLAVFELIIEKGAPEKVIIDEAVELAKEYGSDSSSAFINGVLGKILEP